MTLYSAIRKILGEGWCVDVVTHPETGWSYHLWTPKFAWSAQHVVSLEASLEASEALIAKSLWNAFEKVRALPPAATELPKLETLVRWIYRMCPTE